MGRRPQNGQIASELGALAKEITLSNILASTPLEPYFSISSTLGDALRQSKMVPNVRADDERWIEAIQIVLAYNQRKNPQQSATYHPSASDITFALAIRYFTDKGIDIPLIGDEIHLHSKGAWSAVAATVASPLLALGDTFAIQYLDTALAAKFDPSIWRVHLHPTPDMMGNKLDRSLPIGYLYRIALKALGRNRCRDRKLKATQSAIADAAKHLAALYEVEPFSTYETVFPPHPERILEWLRNVVLYDELFGIPQCSPVHMEHLMRGLFEEVFRGTVDMRIHGLCLNEVIRFWRVLLNQTGSETGSTFIGRSIFRNTLQTEVGVSACDRLLKNFTLSSPNKDYCLPTDAGLADTRECALVEASGERYWIAPRPFLGPAFFARLVSICIRSNKDISEKIGIAFEKQLLQRMKQLGIQCRQADVAGYKGKKAGDVDLILETEEVIALFELKKKGLRRETMSGDPLQLIIDLTQGLVRGVNQLSRHEITLEKTGELVFTDGSRILLGKRRIIKCIVSLTDYGGLHDGAILRNMMKALCQCSVHSTLSLSDEQQHTLKNANEELDTLRKRYQAFVELHQGDHAADLFDNLMFHNVFFLEYLLLTVPTAEKLLQELGMGNRIVTGTRDPFFEHAWFHAGRH